MGFVEGTVLVDCLRRGRVWNHFETSIADTHLKGGVRYLLRRRVQNLLFWKPQLAACDVEPFGSMLFHLSSRTLPYGLGKRALFLNHIYSLVFSVVYVLWIFFQAELWWCPCLLKEVASSSCLRCLSV